MQSAALGVYLMVAGAILVLIVSGWVAFQGWPGQRADGEQVGVHRVGQMAKSPDEPLQRVVVGSRVTAERRSNTRSPSTSREVQPLSAPATPSRLGRTSRRKPARRRSPSPSRTAPAPAPSSTPVATQPPAPTVAPNPVGEVVDEALDAVDDIIQPLLPKP